MELHLGRLQQGSLTKGNGSVCLCQEPLRGSTQVGSSREALQKGKGSVSLGQDLSDIEVKSFWDTNLIFNSGTPDSANCRVHLDRPAMNQEEFHRTFEFVPQKLGFSGIKSHLTHQHPNVSLFLINFINVRPNQSVSTPVCLIICISPSACRLIIMSVYWSECLSICCLKFQLQIHLCVCLFLHLSVGLHIILQISIPKSMTVCIFIHLSRQLSVCSYVDLSVCTFIYPTVLSSLTFPNNCR